MGLQLAAWLQAGVTGAAAEEAQGRVSGEKLIVKQVLYSTRTSDGVEVEAEDRSKLIAFVAAREHLFRLFSPERRRVLLTKRLDFTSTLMFEIFTDVLVQMEDDIETHSDWEPLRQLGLLGSLRFEVAEKHGQAG